MERPSNSAIRDAPDAPEATSDTCAGCVLPNQLLDRIFERVPVPVVVSRVDADVFLNAEARSLWPADRPASPRLPVIVEGELRSLLTLHCTGSGSVQATAASDIHVHVPGRGDRFEAGCFFWRPADGLPEWQVLILRPVDRCPGQGRLLDDRINRLKAIVHEFRNTLTAAREALAFVQEEAVGRLNDEQRRFIGSAIEDLEGLGRATMELTSLWVTPARVLRLMPRPVDVGHILEQTTLWAKPVAEKRGISLRVEIEGRPPVLVGDQELLVQALRNVVTNALRHTSTGGEIRVRASVAHLARPVAHHAERAAHTGMVGQAETDDTIVITIEDTGSGIGAVDQQRVFEPFERATTGGDVGGVPAGMGLGLAIARDITQGHGGTLEVSSAPNQGSCFVFRFPKSKTSAQSWMLRATRQAIGDVRPLRAPLACVLFRIYPDGRDPTETIHPELLSAIQQVAIQKLRSTDTALAIDGQLLLLIRGSTRSAAYAMIDRTLHSLIKLARTGGKTFGEYCIAFGVAAYPDDGGTPEAILARAEEERNAFL